MKKLLLLFAAVGMIFTACEAGGGLNEGGNGTPASSDKIATIEEQGANIKATIATLETTKSAVNATIASLNEQQPVTRGNDNGNNGVKDMIAALEERLAALEQMIANLKEYADGDLSGIQDWAEATFATMEQYNALASELATLKALLESFEGVSTAELSEALAASEESMKQWVNEQLSGYATIAEVEAQIAVLKESLTAELNEEIEKVVATLTALMNDTKQEYEKAISEAIQNQGVINDKIAEDIANINKRIDEELATINKRLDDIEKRLDEIEETLENLVKQIQSVSYIKKYGDEPTPVVTSAEGASVTLDFEISPKSAVEGLALKWKEFVKVQALYSGTTDFIDMPTISFSANAKNGIITVVASGENLSQEFYNELTSASLRLEISDGNNDKRSEYILIAPQRWMNDRIDLEPAHNEIYYTTADSNSITLANIKGFEETLQTNLYDQEKGVFVLKFDGDISSIGNKAFDSYSNLTGIAIPNSVTSIGDLAFYNCTSLKSITIPDSVTSIGYSTFAYCRSLTSATIGNSVTSIGRSAFYDCTGELIINNKIIETDYNEVNYPAEINGWLHGSNFTKCTIGDNITKIGNFAFCGFYSLTSVTIPDSVTSIGYAAFYGCTSLTTITIPDSVTLIGDSAFSYCTSLITITIPDSVTLIGDFAFCDCTSLTSVTIGKSVTSIGEQAFVGCTSQEAFYGKYASPDNRCLIVDGTLNYCASAGLTEYTIPNSVTSIGNSAFYNCTSLISVTIPDSVTSIGEQAFVFCTSLTTITIPDSVTSIGEQAFVFCTSLEAFYGKFASADNRCLIIDGVLHSFAPVGLTEYTIPNSVTSIGRLVFCNCTSLTSVTMPDSVTSIGDWAFYNCTSLTSVYCKPTTPPTGGSSMFSSNASGGKIYVPRNSESAYKAADGWSNYADYIVGYDF